MEFDRGAAKSKIFNIFQSHVNKDVMFHALAAGLWGVSSCFRHLGLVTTTNWGLNRKQEQGGPRPPKNQLV